MWLDFGHSVKAFPKRHKEATEFIEAVYRYYREEGKWPDPGDANQGGAPSLPPEWTYDWLAEEGTPVLLLHGPYHMILVYYFSPPNSTGIDGTWVLSIEGDKKKFQADVDYD